MSSRNKKSLSVQTVVYLPDIHIPYEDKKACRAVLKYLRVFKPDITIIGGDLMDFDCISDHNLRNLRAVESKTLEKDYKAANDFLDELQAGSSERQLFYLQGNHEYRVDRYINANPRMEGLIEVPKNLHLYQRGIKWIPSWSDGETFEIGKALFLHGRYHNEQHAKKMVLAYEQNTFYGHTHDIQQYAKVNAGDNNTKVGQSLGCLCKYKQYYMKGAPSRWQQGFGVFYFRPDGFFNYYVPMIFNGSFVGPDGKVYEG